MGGEIVPQRRKLLKQRPWLSFAREKVTLGNRIREKDDGSHSLLERNERAKMYDGRMETAD